jgi:hypothetical protein
MGGGARSVVSLLHERHAAGSIIHCFRQRTLLLKASRSITGPVPQVVRRKKFQRVRSAVAARLFAAKANFLPALAEIWALVDEVRGVAFCAANPSHLYTLQGGSLIISCGGVGVLLVCGPLLSRV